MNKKTLLAIEIIWICVGSFCIIAGVRSAADKGGSHPAVFFLMAIVSFVFAYMRHKQRKNG